MVQSANLGWKGTLADEEQLSLDRMNIVVFDEFGVIALLVLNETLKFNLSGVGCVNPKACKL